MLFVVPYLGLQLMGVCGRDDPILCGSCCSVTAPKSRQSGRLLGATGDVFGVAHIPSLIMLKARVNSGLAGELSLTGDCAGSGVRQEVQNVEPAMLRQQCVLIQKARSEWCEM